MPIDRLDELDAVWMGPPASAGRGGGRTDAEAGTEVREDAELVRCVVTGEGLHVEMCALAARYIGRGVDAETVANLLRGLLWPIPRLIVMPDGITGIGRSGR